MEFECDKDLIEKRLRLIKCLNYITIIVFPVVLYINSTALINNELFPIWLMIFALTLYALKLIGRHFDDALEHHSSDLLCIYANSVEFHHHGSGYRFQRNNNEIISVKLTRFLGTPKVRIRLTNNEFYDFVWFKNSDSLYQALKNREDVVKKA
ncbi:hypothetical protein MOV00_004374 [Vibrio vulnificus]|nr:hypothetical protein [Vibrio vulnificus]EKG2462302.1 hypothetical protein [Vibrio vulnificus]